LAPVRFVMVGIFRVNLPLHL